MKRDADQARQAADESWLKYLRAAVEDGGFRRLLPLPIDGLVLVDSRTTEYAAHEVQFTGRAAVRCTAPCGQLPACYHRASAGLACYVEELARAMGVSPDEIAVEQMPAVQLRRLIHPYLTEPSEVRHARNQWKRRELMARTGWVDRLAAASAPTTPSPFPAPTPAPSLTRKAVALL